MQSTRDFYYSNLVRKVRCTGTAGIAVRRGLFAVAATRDYFSAVSRTGGHRGKIVPSRSDRKQTLPDCNSVVHGTLVWVTRVQRAHRDRHSDFSCMQVSITQLILRISPPAEYEFRIPVFHIHVPRYCAYGELRAAGDSESLDLTCT